MNKSERMVLLGDIVKGLRVIRKDYIDGYPGEYMISMAISFLNSLLKLEEHDEKITPIRNYLGETK